LEPGASRRYTFRAGRKHAVQNYGYATYIAMLRRDGSWYLATVLERHSRSIRLKVVLDGDGHPSVTADSPWRGTERVLRKKELLDVLGDWQHK